MKQLIGIDIGGTTVKIGFLDTNGNILNKFEIVTNKANKGENILKDVSISILEYISKNNIDTNDIEGIGFGIPGPVVNNIVTICVNLGWVNKNVAEEFSNLIPFKTKIACANDANVAALGEMWKGNDLNYTNAIMLTLGTGVGGGVIVDGKAIDGVNGAGGELGHVKSDFKYNFQCNCGLKGCLETVTSATGVVNIAKAKLKSNKSNLSTIENLTCKDVFDNAKLNDPIALEVVQEVYSYLGHICSILSATTNPEVIIIGGGVSKAGDMLIEGIKKSYNEFAFTPVKNTSIILATLGNDAGMIGAASLVK